jgi:hypothetical protein
VIEQVLATRHAAAVAGDGLPEVVVQGYVTGVGLVVRPAGVERAVVQKGR